MTVPIEKWGRDHVSTFAYLMTCITSKGGVIVKERMRCGPQHPGLRHRGSTGETPCTRLKGKEELPGDVHDDWDILDDLVAAGLFKHVGTGMMAGKVYDPSPRAIAWAKQIWAAEALGGNWSRIELSTIGVPP